MSPQFWGMSGRRWLEMGPLYIPVVTSYRLPIVTLSLSRTVFAVLRLVTNRQKDRRNWSNKRRQYALKSSDSVLVKLNIIVTECAASVMGQSLS